MNTFRKPPSVPSDGMQTGNVKDHLQKTFSIDYKSTMNEERYVGQFTVKKQSIKDMGRIGVLRSQLNGGYYYDEENPGIGIDAETHAIHNMIAHFEVLLIQVPSWWDLEVLWDTGLFGEVFKHVMEFESSFFRSSKSESGTNTSQSSTENSQSTIGQSGTAGSVAALGGGEIPAALDS